MRESSPLKLTGKSREELKLEREQEQEREKTEKINLAMNRLKAGSQTYKEPYQEQKRDIGEMLPAYLDALETFSDVVAPAEKNIQGIRESVGSGKKTLISELAPHVQIFSNEFQAQAVIESLRRREKGAITKYGGNDKDLGEFVVDLLNERDRVDRANEDLILHLVVDAGQFNDAAIENSASVPTVLLPIIEKVHKFKKLALQKQPKATKKLLKQNFEAINAFSEKIMGAAEKLTRDFITKYAVEVVVNKATKKEERMRKTGSIRDYVILSDSPEESKQKIEKLATSADFVKGLTRLGIDFDGIIADSSKEIKGAFSNIQAILEETKGSMADRRDRMAQ